MAELATTTRPASARCSDDEHVRLDVCLPVGDLAAILRALELAGVLLANLPDFGQGLVAGVGAQAEHRRLERIADEITAEIDAHRHRVTQDRKAR